MKKNLKKYQADVDQFLKKLNHWKKETETLRAIILKTNLQENFKWNLPCYTHKGSNIVIVQPFKSYLSLMFFKGTLLKDPKKVLKNNGPNSHSGRRFEFYSAQEITKLASIIKAYIKEAVELEKSGQKIVRKKTNLILPSELKKMFKKNSKFKIAFHSLTPGRQRAYVIYFTGAKQAATRQARIEKHLPRILIGKGLMDR